MINVISVNNMKQSDAHMAEHGVTGAELMKKAAQGVYNSVNWKNQKVAIICGSGNNGGDGYALAEILAENNISCFVFRVFEEFSSDGVFYCKRAEKAGASVEMFDSNVELSEFDIIVDCIFGTGFHGVPQGLAKTAIEAINASGSYVVSVDINSGLNGDSGFATLAVKSNLTVSIGYYKTGMFLNDAPQYINKLINVDIGIHLVGQQYHLVDKEQTDHFTGYGSLVIDSNEFVSNYNINKEEKNFVDKVISISCTTKQILVIKTKKSVVIADQTYVYFQADYAKAQ